MTYCPECHSTRLQHHTEYRGPVYYIHTECLDCGNWDVDEEGGI